MGKEGERNTAGPKKKETPKVLLMYQGMASKQDGSKINEEIDRMGSSP